MDRLGAMQLFVRVAELGSFAAVAKQLNAAPSVVTRQVAALEAHLGCKLMERSTRRLRLTSSGADYLEQCRVILNLVEVAETDIAAARQAPRGHVRVSLPLVFGTRRVAPLLLEFAGRYPEVSLDMEYSDKPQNLIEEGIDFSIRITTRLAAGDIARKLGISRMKTVAAPAYLARHGRPRLPAELAHHELLGYTYAMAGQLRFLVDGRAENVPVRGRLNANNGTILAEAAAQGLGVYIGPDFIVDEFIEAGRLDWLLAEYPLPELGIHAVLPSNRQVPHRIRVLIDFLAERLR
ncbi:MAG: LysR family transcriptional regulator [Rhodocyclaceae bacterium]|nr:LysR family transcriptional regulator [Rhodocyclaceae bacterium]